MIHTVICHSMWYCSRSERRFRHSCRVGIVYLFALYPLFYMKKKLSHFVLVKIQGLCSVYIADFFFMTECVYFFVEALLVTLSVQTRPDLMFYDCKNFNLCENQCRKLNTYVQMVVTSHSNVLFLIVMLLNISLCCKDHGEMWPEFWVCISVDCFFSV